MYKVISLSTGIEVAITYEIKLASEETATEPAFDGDIVISEYSAINATDEELQYYIDNYDDSLYTDFDTEIEEKLKD